ncbi:hypothetical protein, partial [Rhizobium sp. NZLR11]|uniref:hypothetical protein n=1 Tax=Rhizobium sp. NZLR11 TaxID=2731098 RepID=UPI001C83B4B1
MREKFECGGRQFVRGLLVWPDVVKAERSCTASESISKASWDRGAGIRISADNTRSVLRHLFPWLEANR